VHRDEDGLAGGRDVCSFGELGDMTWLTEV
jgi:hypothetical protein